MNIARIKGSLQMEKQSVRRAKDYAVASRFDNLRCSPEAACVEVYVASESDLSIEKSTVGTTETLSFPGRPHRVSQEFKSRRRRRCHSERALASEVATSPSTEASRFSRFSR